MELGVRGIVKTTVSLTQPKHPVKTGSAAISKPSSIFLLAKPKHITGILYTKYHNVFLDKRKMNNFFLDRLFIHFYNEIDFHYLLLLP
jgi:hypothetical protein